MGWDRRATAADVAARVRSGRLGRGLNQQALASEAGVHRTVVARVEAGGESRPSSLRKIAGALGVTLTWLRRPFLAREPYRVDRAGETLWVATNPSFVRRRGLVTPESLLNEAERLRLGSLGLANAFVRVLNTDLPGGRLHALVVESYRREQQSVSFPGQMFLYVLKGRIRLGVEEDAMELGPGDCVSYWGDKANLYEPVEGSELPAVILEIFIDLSDEEIAVRDLFPSEPSAEGE